MPPTSSILLAGALLAFLALAFRALSRAWPDHLPWGPRPLLVPAMALLVGVFHLCAAPEATGPDAAVVAAVRAESGLPPGAGTFHLLAWPLAALVGDAPAVAAVAAFALALVILLAHALARGLGAGPLAAMAAQAILLASPEIRAALGAGRLPSVLGLAGEIALVAHLGRRLPVLEAARDGAAACAFLVAAQACYAGALPVVAALVGTVAAVEAATGKRRHARWLLGAYGIALALVVVAAAAVSLAAGARPDVAALIGGTGARPASAFARPDAVARLALALALLALVRPPPPALRAQVAGVVAGIAVAVLSAGTPVLAEHALAFAAAPVAAMAAVTAALLLKRRRR